MGVSAVCITINTSYALDSAVVGNANVAKRLPTFKADVEPVTDGRMEYILDEKPKIYHEVINR